MLEGSGMVSTVISVMRIAVASKVPAPVNVMSAPAGNTNRDLAKARRLVNGGRHGLEPFTDAYRRGQRTI